MTAPASKAREALDALTPLERESNKVMAVVAELLDDQNDLIAEQNTVLRELLDAVRASATTVNDVEPAGTSAGAGRPAPDTSAGKETPVRLTEPDVPPADEESDQDTTGGRPAMKAAAAKKTTTPAKSKSPRRGQGGR